MFFVSDCFDYAIVPQFDFYCIEVEGIYLFVSGVPDQSPDLLYSYLEEAAMGRDLRLHVVLFNVDDYDVNGAIPSRYANIAKTAEILRNMAHCTGGRFQWLRETGDLPFLNSFVCGIIAQPLYLSFAEVLLKAILNR